MADQTFFTLKQGATGTAFVTTLKQTVALNTLGAVDLSDYQEVWFVATKVGRNTRVIYDQCVINPDQVNLKGKVRYEFTDTTANIPTGAYDVEFHAKDADDEWHYFPSNRTAPYGKLYVEKGL